MSAPQRTSQPRPTTTTPTGRSCAVGELGAELRAQLDELLAELDDVLADDPVAFLWANRGQAGE